MRPLRAEAAAAALTQRRFETEPGEQAQVDWGQVRVRSAARELAEVHIFVMTLGYSRRAWAEGYEHERMASLLAAHEHAFEHFGGLHRARSSTTGCARSSSAASEGKPRWNPTFEAFARHWGFEPRLCRPYRAQTKGKVESGVKYVKRNFLPGRVFRDLEDFNDAARRLADRDRRRARPRHHPRAADRALRRARPAPWCHARASRASCRRCAASGSWPRTGWSRSTPTATRCRSG